LPAVPNNQATKASAIINASGALAGKPNMDRYTPMPSVRTIGPKLPFSAKEVKYVLSSDGSYGLLAFTEGGVFQLNETLNRWEPRSKTAPSN
jgi:hypothetical protein